MLISLRAPEAVLRDAANSRPVQLVQAYLTFLQYMPYPNRSCDLCGMTVGEEVDIMHRRTPVAPAPAVNQREVDLAYQVGRLSEEIEQLRQQQNLRSSPPPQTQAVAERPRIPTVLVFRDGHRIEIQNYAIVGQTLWVDEKAADKIS